MYYTYSSLKCVTMADTLITKIAAYELKKRLTFFSDFMGGSDGADRDLSF